MTTQFTIKGTKAAAERLGVALSTLQDWLLKDEKRRTEERRFGFDRMRGQMRVWTEDGFAALEEAIDRESRDGVLSRWRTRKADIDGSTRDEAARQAMDAVLNHKTPKETK